MILHGGNGLSMQHHGPSSCRLYLYFVMTRLIKPEMDDLKDSKALIKAQLKELGKMSKKEMKLVIISVLLLIAWATEGILHPFDSTSVTFIAVAIMLLPGVGVYTWKEVERKIPWGTLIVLAVGLSRVSVLLSTKGAEWLSMNTLEAMGLSDMPLIGMIMVLSLFNILIHLGFAECDESFLRVHSYCYRTRCQHGSDRFQWPGLVLIQQFVISFGFLFRLVRRKICLPMEQGLLVRKIC